MVFCKNDFAFIDDDKYSVLIGKPGFHLDHRDTVSTNLAIFDQAILPDTRISKKYTNVPPKIAIEVDISIDSAYLPKKGIVVE